MQFKWWGLIYFPLRIHSCMEVGCVEAINIVIKWTPGNLHIYVCEIGLGQTRKKQCYDLHFPRFLQHGSVVWVQHSWQWCGQAVAFSSDTHPHIQLLRERVRSAQPELGFKSVPTRQSRKWVLVPVRSRGKWGARVEKVHWRRLGVPSHHHNQSLLLQQGQRSTLEPAGRRGVVAAAVSLMCSTWDYSDVYMIKSCRLTFTPPHILFPIISNVENNPLVELICSE